MLAKCLVSATGAEYLGQMSTTVKGRTCKPWSLNLNRFLPGDTPGNYCRNPLKKNLASLSHSSLWCYTTDPKVRWDNCDVKACDEC